MNEGWLQNVGMRFVCITITYLDDET